MARMLGCSSSFLHKRSKLLGVPIRSRMAAVDEEELENVLHSFQILGVRLCELHGKGCVRCWSVSTQQLLRGDGVAQWLEECIMCPIRWGFVIHSAIDGHLRLITI